jgi:prophage regulatory protein
MKTLRFSQVKEKTGMSRATVDRLERAGKFPRRHKISQRLVGWIESEVDDWITKRPID